MPAGFQSFVAGTTIIQIDQDYKNTHLRNKITVNSGDAISVEPNNRWQRFRVALSSMDSIIAVRSTAQPVYLAGIVNESGTTYAYFRVLYNSNAYSFTVYEFDPNMAAVPTNAGIEIYAANGSLVFSSALVIMDIITVQEVALFGPGTQTLATEPAGRQYAIVAMKSWYGIETGDTFIARHFGGMIVRSGNANVESFVGRYSTTSNTPDFTDFAGAYAVVDVTGA